MLASRAAAAPRNEQPSVSFDRDCPALNAEATILRRRSPSVLGPAGRATTTDRASMAVHVRQQPCSSVAVSEDARLRISSQSDQGVRRRFEKHKALRWRRGTIPCWLKCENDVYVNARAHPTSQRALWTQHQARRRDRAQRPCSIVMAGSAHTYTGRTRSGSIPPQRGATSSPAPVCSPRRSGSVLLVGFKT